MNALTDAPLLSFDDVERRGRRPRPGDGQPVHQGPAGHRDARRPALPRRQADPGRVAAPAARPEGRPADRRPAAHPHPQDPRRPRDRPVRAGAARPTASRCPGSTRPARWPASAAAACTATARWRAPSSAAASSPAVRRGGPPRARPPDASAPPPPGRRRPRHGGQSAHCEAWVLPQRAVTPRQAAQVPPVRRLGVMESRQLGQDRPPGLGRRPRLLAARRRLGRRRRGRRARGAARRGRRRGHVPRHRRRLRRRPQRDADRPGAARARRRRPSPWRPRWAAGPTRTCPEAFTSRTSAPGSTAAGRNLGVDTPRPGPAALPADAGLLRRRGLRRPRHPGRRAGDRRLRRQRRDRRRGAHRDRPAARRDRADHPQRVPAQAARARCCPPRAAAGVGIIARVPLASGLLSGKYDESTTFAADDHRTYNRARRGVRRRRDVLRRALRRRRPGRRARSPR